MKLLIALAFLLRLALLIGSGAMVVAFVFLLYVWVAP